MMESIDLGSKIVWRPTPDQIERARLTEFMRQHQITDFAELLRRSTEDVVWFTQALLDYLDIRFYRPYESVLDLSRGIAWPSWCVGGQMNIVHNCLDKYIGTEVEGRIALTWEGEEGAVRKLTYGELNRKVSQVANALRSLGLGKGDAIGLFMPMCRRSPLLYWQLPGSEV